MQILPVRKIDFLVVAIAMAAIIGNSTHVLGDEVFLKNGDRISGTVISKEGGTLVLKTAYAGKVKINWADIVRLSVDKPVQVLTDDRTLLEGVVSTVDDKTIKVSGADEEKSDNVTLDKVRSIIQPDKSTLKKSGQLNLGFSRDRGNTDEDNYHVDAEAQFRWIKDRVIVLFDADVEKTDNDKTKEEFDLIGYYDRFVSEKWFFNSGLWFEHDKFADLDLRTTINAGIGHQFFDDDRTFLATQVGPGYVWENFDEGEDQDYAVGVWSLRFTHFLLPQWKLQAFYNHRFTQSLESSSDYIFKSKTGLRIPIFEHFQATLQFNFDRDNAPGVDAKKNDYEYLLTVGYVW